LNKRDLTFPVAFIVGTLVFYIFFNRLDLLPPVLIGVIVAFTLSIFRRKRAEKRGIPNQDERTEAVSKRVMLTSLFWSYLILGVGLIIWIGFGYVYIKAIYVMMYISAVIFITALLMHMAKKRT